MQSGKVSQQLGTLKSCFVNFFFFTFGTSRGPVPGDARGMIGVLTVEQAGIVELYKLKYKSCNQLRSQTSDGMFLLGPWQWHYEQLVLFNPHSF